MKLTIISLAVLALGIGGCSSPSENRYDRSGGGEYRRSNCHQCGVVENISRIENDRRTTGAGAVAGAVTGGVVGHEVGDGKTAPTVGGAVAGGLAGNAIEKRRDRHSYHLNIRMNDGRRVEVTQGELDGIDRGSHVVVRDGRAYLD
jgi:outer membrane lipoprotein SlyB